jgi:hypothetical protein
MDRLLQTKDRHMLWLLIALLCSVVTNAQRRVGRNLSEVGKVVKFRLIDSDANSVIMDIANGQVLKLAQLSAKNFNIEAVTAEGTVGSVQFGYQGIEKYSVESRAPYALCGDDPKTGDYKMCPKFADGSHVVTATPFYESYARGTAGARVEVRFTVSNELPTPTNTPRAAPRPVPTNAPRAAPRPAPTNPPRPAPTNAPKPAPTKAPVVQQTCKTAQVTSFTFNCLYRYS